jgi:succinate dehydrogenase / fumarate reductase cytochrome b subunit
MGLETLKLFVSEKIPDRFRETAMPNADLKANRPLSPHLQVYRWPLTMAMSIAHRVTGGALYFGMLLLAWWLTAAAAGEAYFDFVNRIFTSWIGLIILFGFTWALVHHMLGGLRHFVWDFGYGLGQPARDRLALANIVLSVAITILLWIIGFGLR